MFIENIIAAYICVSVGGVIGYIGAALLFAAKNKEKNSNE